jgi:hypothetical protein
MRTPTLPSADEIAPPLHWPSLSAEAAERRWPELVEWVDGLRERYTEDLDTHVIPVCWFRHPSHVAALQALKDHERVSYGTVSPGAAGTDWHRAYRDLTMLLRQFTSRLTCGAEHKEGARRPATNRNDVAEFIAGDVDARRERAINHSQDRWANG